MRYLSFVLVLAATMSSIALADVPATQPALSTTTRDMDGLQVTVTLPKASFADDEQPKFTVQFKNVSDKPIALYDVGWFWNWSIRFEDSKMKGPWQLRLLAKLQREKPVVSTLKPGETVDVIVDLGKHARWFDFVWKGVQDEIVAPLKQLHPGKYRLILDIPLGKGPDGQEVAFWIGTVTIKAVEFEISDKPAASQAAAATTQSSPLQQVKLAVGMKRTEAERLIAEASGVKSKYDLYAMDHSTEATYRHGPVTLLVRYKPGAPAPWVRMPDGKSEHLPLVDGEVLSWEIATEKPATTQTTEAVRVNGLDFQIVGATTWVVPGGHKPTTIPLALRITNSTDKAVQVNLFDTITIHLKDAPGKELPVDGGRNGLRPCPPLSVDKGQSGTVDRSAELQPLAGKRGQFRLLGSDGAGGIWYFDGLKPGQYTLRMTYENAKDGFWIGKVVTKVLAVEITEKPAVPATRP